MHPTNKTEVAREYLRTLNDPDIPTQTVARALHKRHKSLFPTIENARDTVRRVRGNMGSQNRKWSKPDLYREPKPAGWNIPPGIEQVLPCRRFTEPGKWLGIMDVHVPFHDEKALEEALNAGLREGCEHVFINGDFYDFHQISKYERDLNSLDILGELKIGQPILDQIGKRFPGRKVYKVGNHDHRFDKFLMNAVPELARSDKLRLAAFLELGAMGFEVVANTQQYMIGTQPVYHGHEPLFGMGNPALFARNIFRTLQTNLIVGHGHGSHTVTETLAGRPHTVYFVGCLARRQNYRPVTNQTQGYAIVTVNKDGTTVVENRRI
jgi:calcineurin-like phosphoesterase family protein